MTSALLTRFAGRIKALREEQRLSVREVAAFLRCDVGSLYSIERGRHAIQFSRLEDLAVVLRVDELDLFTFPEASARHELVDLTRAASVETIARARELLRRVDDDRPRRPRR